MSYVEVVGNGNRKIWQHDIAVKQKLSVDTKTLGGTFNMEIQKEQNNTTLTIKVIGRLDAGSAPELSKELTTALDGITDLTFDFAELQYIASAGLRVLLVAQKRMNKQGSMKLIHVNETVMEVLDMTGFASLMTIE